MWGFGSEIVWVGLVGVGEGRYLGFGELVVESRLGDLVVVWVS